jgi:hypothetical protein
MALCFPLFRSYFIPAFFSCGSILTILTCMEIKDIVVVVIDTLNFFHVYGS